MIKNTNIGNMLKPKEKPCKGIGKAKGFEGCGTMQIVRTYGLGHKCGCFNKWRIEQIKAGDTSVISSIAKKAKKQVETKRKEEKSERKRQRVNYKGKLQEKVQEIARLIDLGHPCLARDRMVLSYDGGHCYGKGSHPECSFNLHNIFAQDSKSNQSTKEDALMTEGLRRVFGEDYFRFVESLKNKPPQKHLKPEIEKMYRIAHQIANNLKKEGKMHSTAERITLRNDVNLKIGFYPKELCVFEK